MILPCVRWRFVGRMWMSATMMMEQQSYPNSYDVSTSRSSTTSSSTCSSSSQRSTRKSEAIQQPWQQCVDRSLLVVFQEQQEQLADGTWLVYHDDDLWYDQSSTTFFSAEQHEDHDTLGSLGGMPSFFLSNSIGTYIPSNSGVWLVKQERMLCM